MTEIDPSSSSAARGRRRGSRLPYTLALLGLAILVGAAWLGRGRFEPAIAGKRAPAFRVTDLSGRPVTLDHFQGKVVLLNVWATWCAPCREEMPSMQRLYQEMQGKDFEMVAVSVDDAVDGAVPKDALDKFAAELGLSFPMYHSTPDSPDDIQKAYQTTGVPESFLIGKDGIIYRRLSSATPWDSPQYREQILRLIAE